MIGDDYFELRSRIGTDLLALATIVRESGGDPESAAILDNLIASLKEPFVFVVVGEVNVGKSTFLNALFGQDFSSTGVVPTTGKILFFRHGEEHAIVPITPTLDEVHAPVDFLRDFHIVDTPGTNSVENEHQLITERFVPIADLVIFVFSAMNPWGASAWEFLQKVHREWMRHVIFVLQQCDLRSPEEIQVITDYMGQLTRQRFGRDFPLFPVSAKKAFLARGAGIERDRLLQESGYTALESHISSIVRHNSARLHKLASTMTLARQILERMRERYIAAMQQARRKAAVLQELQTERELQVDRTLKKILPALDATERDYHESVLRVAGLASDALATRKAFQRKDADETAPDSPEATRPQSLDHRLFQELQHRTGDRWRQVGLVLEEDVHQFERYLYAQGRGILFPTDVSLPAHDYGEDESELRRRFGTHIDSSLRRFVIGLQLDEGIEPGLENARVTARWFTRLIAPVILAPAITAWLDGPVGAAIALGAGLLLLAVVYLLTQVRLSQSRNAILDKLEESSVTLRALLHKQVTDDVTASFTRFLDTLTPAQADAARVEQEQSTQVERLRLLGDSFTALEHQIQTLTPVGR
ncbi:dynamin family protein [Prosthecobacter vanneervenii]|uniref:GTPase SAR1 family protein n=1 Tax=Prosthecobacter vanneervenii TaxID=48466 RepID=A0A7W8DLX2_9BACT|nr:dynamin family protein [Prosthecobacter vanneervenii]MBB5034490.1 GTPase SAR1 family protein [Prosthecobacter vanneervenii]